MAMQIDKVIDDLSSGSLTLEATRDLLFRASKADPVGTRFWDLSIEAAMQQQRISRVTGRALLDALEGFASDRTVWIDCGMLEGARAPERIRSAEHLLAEILGTTDVNVPMAAASGAAPLTGPVEWYDSKAFDTNNSLAPDRLGPGAIVKGRYRLVEHLGAGGIGQVFDAVDQAFADDRRHVTVKIVAVNLRHQPDALATLETAVRKTQHLAHPNIATIHDIGQHGDSVFIVMEPLRGRWLSSLIRAARGSGMPYAIAWPIIAGIANGLAHAHGHGVVHADLSPHSVFVCDDGTPKIMCFGLIDALPSSNESLDVLDTQTLRAYTEAYAADPWSQSAQLHPADDLYPLGVIAYEMLTGVHPFQRHSLSVARQKNLKVAPIVGLNHRARKLLERCLCFERNDRPQDADRFLRKMQPGLWERVMVG